QSIPFEADALFIFDVASQRWRTYSSNSPTWLNESFAEHLSSGAVVWVRRDPGDQRGGITWPASSAPGTVAHAQTLAVPPAGGATAGVAGTSSVAALLGVQSFEVRGVFAFDVAQQRYLTYSPGVPAWANSLPEDGLRADGIVWLSRESNRSSGGVPVTGASIIRHVTYEDDQPMMTSDQAPPNGVGRQTDAVRAGSSAGYAIVRPGDPRSHAGGFRSEWHGSDHTGDGTERWYGISYYLPSD